MYQRCCEDQEPSEGGCEGIVRVNFPKVGLRKCCVKGTVPKRIGGVRHQHSSTVLYGVRLCQALPSDQLIGVSEE